ncbi:hypothetical protein [Candidatus Parabeggiatoa sp. HSG14]|uniref:hypothetical protein n=1 Tax=Candidatus Parabeggiatoa sp. HSG14 TaxID=3055593 RepID=UPI0025A86E29|nr:hypothetical protein [Thiotrichales bacterium HSG14]
MERCPVCRARLKSNIPVCPRCGTNLSMPLNIEHQAEKLIYQSIMQISAGHFGDAIQLLEQSLQLKHSLMARVLRGFITHSQIR